MLINATLLTQSELRAAIVRNPLVVTPNTMVMDAIAQMSGVRAICSTARPVDNQMSALHVEARSSCVIIVEGDHLLGIFTERDVVRLSAQNRSLENLPIREVMTHSVITLQESAFTDLFFAINVLQQQRIRHLPILDEHDRLVGLLTHESLRQISRPIDLLRLRQAAEVMTSDVICAAPNVSMLVIAQLMAEYRVSSAMIVEERLRESESRGEDRSQPNLDDRLVIPIGIVTERDMVQFQALNLALATCEAQSVMSAPIFSVSPDESLWAVQQTMEQRFIRRLAVTGSQGELLGIVTQSSLLQALNPLELYKLAEVLERKVLRLEADKVELLQNRTLQLEQEVEERTAHLKAKAEQEHLIANMAAQIRSSLNLPDILNTTVEKVRVVLGCDRVAIWQIQPDWQLLAVAESTSGKINHHIGQQVSDLCFSPDLAKAYQQGRVRVVSDIYTTEMADCHRALLERLQTRAKILVPILHTNTLWGMLQTTESSVPRQWKPEEVALLEQLATHLAIAIQQATTYQQVQIELTERRAMEMRLRASEQRYATLNAAAPVGIFRIDAEGKSIYTNQRCCEILGLTPEATTGNRWQQALHPEDRAHVIAETIRSRQENRSFHLEYRILRLDGTVIWVLGQTAPEYDAQGQIIGHVGTITDITDLKQAQKLIVHNALHDPLTDLPNRTLLTERLELAINRSSRNEDYHYAVLFLDLDRFKVINDSLGHLVGDQLLINIAQKLKKYLRRFDLVARLGGDEFVILLEDITSTQEIIYVAERILADCQTPVIVNGYETFTSFSIGIVFGTKAYDQASDLIRDADIAMYRAKAQGRNSYKFFDSAMHTQALNRLTLEVDIRKALEQEEFVVYYQPVINILSQQLVGFEALVRWQHPKQGLIFPGEFVPIAEEIGLIVPLDTWLFHKACAQIASWKAQFADCFPLKVSINLSAQDLRKVNLIEDIDRSLAATGLTGDSITLEITESMLIEDIDQTIDLLTQLKARNIQISIDDFGTGYSSLNYLHRLPADNLKIDRSFVSQMEIGNSNYQVVSTIITLGNQLGLTVVAEGIETKQQLQWLQQLGCELGQGYLFSKPLPVDDVEARFLQGTGRLFDYADWRAS